MFTLLMEVPEKSLADLDALFVNSFWRDLRDHSESLSDPVWYSKMGAQMFTPN